MIEGAIRAGGNFHQDITEDSALKYLLVTRTIKRLRHLSKSEYHRALTEAGLESPMVEQIGIDLIWRTLQRARIVLVKDPGNPQSPLLVSRDWRHFAVAYLDLEEKEGVSGTIYLPGNWVEELLRQNERNAIAGLMVYQVFKLVALQQAIPEGTAEAGARALGLKMGVSPLSHERTQFEGLLSGVMTDYFRRRREDKPGAALIIVHTQRDHDPQQVAREAIETLLEQDAVTAVYESVKADSYLTHAGYQIFDYGPNSDPLIFPSREKRFILVGGNLSISILAKFEVLIRRISLKGGEWQIDLCFGGPTYEFEREAQYSRDHKKVSEYLNRLESADWTTSDEGGIKEENERYLSYAFETGSQDEPVKLRLVFWKEFTSLLEDLNASADRKGRVIQDASSIEELAL